MTREREEKRYRSFEQLKDEVFPSLKEKEQRTRYESDAETRGVVLANKAFDEIGGKGHTDSN